MQAGRRNIQHVEQGVFRAYLCRLFVGCLGMLGAEVLPVSLSNQKTLWQRSYPQHLRRNSSRIPTQVPRVILNPKSLLHMSERDGSAKAAAAQAKNAEFTNALSGMHECIPHIST